MNDPIQFAILSFAHYHANFWSEAINDASDAVLVGIWDDNEERGRDAAVRYNTQFWPDLEALLAASDAAGITSETSKHLELVEAAARHHCAILLEKPMARTLDECRQILHAVESAGIKFMQNFPKRYDPINRELAQIVEKGTLGKIALVRVRHANYHLLELGQTAADQWFASPELAGGGSLLDEGIHAADLLLWLLGEPEAACAVVSNATLGLPLDDSGIALFKYPSGTIAEITASGTLVAAPESIEIFGTEGSAVLTGVDLASREFAQAPYLRVFQRGEERGVWQGSPTVPNFRTGHFHQNGPLHFLRYLRGEAEPVVALDEGWKSLAMIEAAYAAASTGQWQPVANSLDKKAKS